MKVGIDFDNTLVCYDEVFHRVAREMRVIPEEVPPNKTAVRDYLRSSGREPIWTEIQGIVYGPRIQDAVPYPGAIEFIKDACGAGHELFVISHKTRNPFIGAAYDLHEAAAGWLAGKGIDRILARSVPEPVCFFELTKEAKLERISKVGCDFFIDDLPEILTHPLFPAGVKKICFDPGRQIAAAGNFTVVHAWSELSNHLL